MDVETAIRATLDRMDRSPFAWGSTDCGIIMADYVEMLAGRDPMAHLRGRYHDAPGAQALYEEFGGYDGLIGHCMAGIGIAAKPGFAARRGDLVSVHAGKYEVAALHLGPMTAFKAERGRRMTRLPIVRAWSCV